MPYMTETEYSNQMWQIEKLTEQRDRLLEAAKNLLGMVHFCGLNLPHEDFQKKVNITIKAAEEAIQSVEGGE